MPGRHFPEMLFTAEEVARARPGRVGGRRGRGPVRPAVDPEAGEVTTVTPSWSPAAQPGPDPLPAVTAARGSRTWDGSPGGRRVADVPPSVANTTDSGDGSAGTRSRRRRDRVQPPADRGTAADRPPRRPQWTANGPAPGVGCRPGSAAASVQALAGLGVERVLVAGLDDQPDGLAHLRDLLAVDPDDELLLAGVQRGRAVDVGVGAELLDECRRAARGLAARRWRPRTPPAGCRA